MVENNIWIVEKRPAAPAPAGHGSIIPHFQGRRSPEAGSAEQ
jgi:hypothetical protein